MRARLEKKCKSINFVSRETGITHSYTYWPLDPKSSYWIDLVHDRRREWEGEKERFRDSVSGSDAGYNINITTTQFIYYRLSHIVSADFWTHLSFYACRFAFVVFFTRACSGMSASNERKSDRHDMAHNKQQARHFIFFPNEYWNQQICI